LQKLSLSLLNRFSNVVFNVEKTAIVSERPQFFFEINESGYYMLNLPALH